ncbi:hypothetical protein BD309DRAFT_992515 [Dichomitus squalens]|uniref:Polysaccharide lyase 14 domain-containing protein n=1 Tax=Dichomitus squalens (strain LYAD-421) TaxID=732165 RepID=R7SNI5_DICSQ|nr:uncharacterized protein DICSQDRAFT_149906 [Dichomitus squalens LYAD-421 SS1]EJF57270.1 hypothetical protein DICSQDRAFT_149906 [Dichomitus squalens LYAD-421 SS1]TBU41247.1 hypothetical protein BD309DRAFT_992515 [Dichomitus squalens]
MTYLFTPHILTGFTTYPTSDVPTLALVRLDDKQLGVHRVSSNTSHNLVVPPVPVPGGDSTTQSWEAFFPAGSINPGNKTSPPGGFGFYLQGPPPFAEVMKQLPDSAEIVFTYSVLFEDGFQFAKGGKLPGIYGGAGEFAYGCTGGRQTDRCKCFNLRLMWREDGIGELYAYLPHVEQNRRRLLLVPPTSIQHPDYGFSVGRGAFRFVSGRWTRVTQRVKMNNVSQENGEIEIYIDGQSVLLATGLVLRTEAGPDGRVQGLHMQTFFGGHSPDWASPKDQRIWFANISGAVVGPIGHDEV